LHLSELLLDYSILLVNVVSTILVHESLRMRGADRVILTSTTPGVTERRTRFAKSRLAGQRSDRFHGQQHTGKEYAMFGAIGDGRAIVPRIIRALVRRAVSTRHRPALHQTILVVDVQDFSGRERNNRHRLEIRRALDEALRDAFHEANIRWKACRREYSGDAIFVLAPPSIPKGLFVESLPTALATALNRHNLTHADPEQIRLRMALHAGEVAFDRHGVTGEAINLAFRLVDAQPLKAALVDPPSDLGIIVSSWFYEDVVRHTDGSPDSYKPVVAAVKKTTAIGWMTIPTVRSAGRG